MPNHIEAVLDHQEAVAKAAPVSGLNTSGAIDLKALKAAEKTARSDAAAVSSEIDTVNMRISEVIASQRRRRHSPWLRWFPDRDVTAALARLRDHRERLRSSHSALAQARLKAEVAAKRGASEVVRLDAKAEKERQAANALAETKLAILARARALISRMPALAYVGARTLLRMATRIERARDQGWDRGTNTWVRTTSESNP